VSRRYNIAVVGVGLVGQRMVQVLRERSFPVASLKLLGRSARRQVIAGAEYEVEDCFPGAFDGVQIAFFAGTEGEKGASTQFGWEAVERGSIVIDNGNDFRMDSRVPLVIPEVNPEHLRHHEGFIASPNCSTIQMAVALAPLHRTAGIERVVVSTYQSVTGSGREGLRELEAQVGQLARGEAPVASVYPHPIAFNAIPQVDALDPEFPGYYREEAKMIRETRKIFDAPGMPITATCVRVPVAVAHSEAVNVKLGRKVTADEARELMATFGGITVVDEPGCSRYPLARDAAGTDGVYIGRVREDPSQPNALDLWVVSDNLRKGAATNTVQIAEKLIEMGLL
jgi:aspartate-semialdehyde dehydrogenase